MDDSTSNSVKEVFGTPFQQYCLHHKLVLKEEKCGAFKVSNVNVLKECIDIVDKYKFDVNNKIYKIQRSKPKPSSNISNRPRRQNETVKNKCKKVRNEATNISKNSYLTKLQLKIHLHDTSLVLPSYTIHNIVKDYILNTARTGYEIYEFIMKETMKDVAIVDYEASIPFVSPILKRLQAQHKKIHYASILKQLNQKPIKSDQKDEEKPSCMYEVKMKQLKTFFDLVFAKVVPLNLFGKLNNIKKIKKALFRLLESPHSKIFNLLPYIEKLDISCIAWLQTIESTKTQWLIVAKFVKWFFTGFLIKILRTQFHVMTLSASDNRRLYVTRSDWCNVQKKFIKEKIRTNTLQPDIKSEKWCPPIGIYKLRLKSVNCRPIFISKHQPKEKNDLILVFKLLRQLQITEYGINNFQEKWKSIVHCKRDSEIEKLCLVSCDVTDAFGSIIQGHLYDIIRSLCEKLPETLVLGSYAVKSEKYLDHDNILYKQYFCDPNLQLPLSPGTFYACTSSKNSQLVKKNWLLQKIWKYIFYQRVKIGRKVYIIGKGIVQGTMLSPILSDIYYNFVLNEHMSILLNSGKIIRYTDDILYSTENETVAKQFLQLIKAGIPKYNCQFKVIKTHSNIVCDDIKTVNNINYIGYAIDCNTLEIKPKILLTDVRYLISFQLKHDLTPMQLFEKRLNNMASLKLSKIVLDGTINSKTTITKILRDTCLLQAKRALCLIEGLFDNIHKNIRKIFKIIRINNMKVARHIIKIFLKFEENMSNFEIYKWNKKILHLLRVNYKQVFKKNKFSYSLEDVV